MNPPSQTRPPSSMMLRFAKGVARAALAVMMLLAATDVLLRKFGGHAILGSAEITELLLVVVVFGGLAPCEAEEGHVRINFALKAAPPRLRSVLDAVTQFLSGLLFAAMTWALFCRAAGLRQWGEVTLDLGLPLYPFAAIAAAGCALTAVVLLRKSWAALRDARNP